MPEVFTGDGVLLTVTMLLLVVLFVDAVTSVWHRPVPAPVLRSVVVATPLLVFVFAVLAIVRLSSAM